MLLRLINQVSHGERKQQNSTSESLVSAVPLRLACRKEKNRFLFPLETLPDEKDVLVFFTSSCDIFLEMGDI